jgi:hypothetical protein
MASRSRAVRRLSVSALLTIVVAAHTADAAEALRAHTIREDYRAAVPVGGVIRRGVVAGNLDARVDAPAFSVFLPRGVAGHLCFTIESRDGRYRGDFDVDVPLQPGSIPVVRRIELSTQYLTQWRTLAARELSIDARRDPACGPGAKDSELIVASWNDASWPTTISVFANIGDTEARLAIPSKAAAGGTSMRTLRCKKLAEPGGGATVAYNADCHIDFRRTDDLSGTILERSDGDILLPPVRLRIAFESGAP